MGILEKGLVATQLASCSKLLLDIWNESCTVLRVNGDIIENGWSDCSSN